MKIPYLDLRSLNAPILLQIEEAMGATLKSGYYLNDETVAGFEKKWANYNGASYCVSTANGLDALAAALIAMKHVYSWDDCSEVIVPANTFIASFEAVTRAGLMPIPCDVSPQDYLMDISGLKSCMSEHTVAIMPVHLYGRACRMVELHEFAKEHSLRILTDSCQMHGHPSSDEGTVEFSDAVAYSFYPGKNLGALGDAGCMVTNNADIASVARAYCNYGAQVKYHHDIKGINSRMDSLQAAILKVKLCYLDQMNSRRQLLAKRYFEGVCNPLVSLPYGDADESKSVWHIFPIFSKLRNELKRFLDAKGIETIIHYPIPVHKQTAYKELNKLSMPVVERLSTQELSIPLNPTITREQQDYIIDALNAFKG